MTDREAEQIARQALPWLPGHCARAGSKADADDAAQRALVLLWRRRARLDPATATAWLRVVATREMYEIARERHGRGSAARTFESLEPRHEPAADTLGAYEDAQDALEAIAAACTPGQVRVLLAAGIGLTYTETAAATGLTYRQVARRLRNGRIAARRAAA